MTARPGKSPLEHDTRSPQRRRRSTGVLMACGARRGWAWRYRALEIAPAVDPSYRPVRSNGSAAR